MPKYTFKCECGWTAQKFVGASTYLFKCPLCPENAPRQMPFLSGPPKVNEVIDSYTGIVQPADQKDQIKERRDEYYWTVEVPRLVNSGTYSVETMLENGWIYLDDDGKIHINNKPPHKR